MSAPDKFGSYRSGLDSPAKDAFAITPNNDNDLAQVARAIYIGGGGNLEVITAGGTTITFTALRTGSILPVRVSRVRAAGTTATALVGLV